MFHKTERLLLRPVWPEDWRAVLGGIADEAIVRNLARAPWPYPEAEARWWTSKPQDHWLPHFAVCDAASGELVGSAGLGLHGGEAELGYWIARPHWGRGYATEAASGVVAVARMLGHERLLGAHYADNPASGRVLRKLGFVPTGQRELRDCAARGGPQDSLTYFLDLEEEHSGLRAA